MVVLEKGSSVCVVGGGGGGGVDVCSSVGGFGFWGARLSRVKAAARQA